MPVVCLLALGASHSRHHDRCRAAVDGFSFDLSDLAGRTISRRVTVDAKKAMSALLALPMDSGVTIEDLATRVRDLKEQQRRNATHHRRPRRRLQQQPDERLRAFQNLLQPSTTTPSAEGGGSGASLVEQLLQLAVLAVLSREDGRLRQPETGPDGPRRA